MRAFLISVLAVLTFTGTIASAQASDPVAEKPKAEQSYDPSKWFDLLLGAQAGGGLDHAHDPTAFAGCKIGAGPLTLDLQYDRVRGRNGFSTEISGMLPVVRFPFHPKSESSQYIRFYAEPGVGYRAGGTPFGGYSSAKVMVALMSDKKLYSGDSLVPYIEYQHRFPFNSPLRGDDRIAFGVMLTICSQCGFD